MIPVPIVNRTRRPRNSHVLTKPIGALFNLDCTYCYYLHKEHLLDDRTGKQMTDEIVAEFIKQYRATGPGRTCPNWPRKSKR